MRPKLPPLGGMYMKELRSFCTGEASLHLVLMAHSGSHLPTNPRLKSWVYKEDVIVAFVHVKKAKKMSIDIDNFCGPWDVINSPLHKQGYAHLYSASRQDFDGYDRDPEYRKIIVSGN